MDWVLLVPLEFISNSVQMKGIANMQDYKTAFEDKGVIGSVIELAAPAFSCTEAPRNWWTSSTTNIIAGAAQQTRQATV